MLWIQPRPSPRVASKLAALVQMFMKASCSTSSGAGAVAHDAQRHTEQTAAFMLVKCDAGPRDHPSRSRRGRLRNQTWKRRQARRAWSRKSEQTFVSGSRRPSRRRRQAAASKDDVTAFPRITHRRACLCSNTTGGRPCSPAQTGERDAVQLVSAALHRLVDDVVRLVLHDLFCPCCLRHKRLPAPRRRLWWRAG